MVRSRGTNVLLRKAKVFKLSKGYLGRSRNCWKLALRRVNRAMRNMYDSRRLKKRDFRALWITRINAGAREHGITYSRFQHHIQKSDIALNRKMLANLSIYEPTTFKGIANIMNAREYGNEGLRGVLKPVDRPKHILERVRKAEKQKAIDFERQGWVYAPMPDPNPA